MNRKKKSAPEAVPNAAAARPAPEKVSESDLGNFIGYALRRAQLRVFDDFYKTLSIAGITPARFSALVIVDANPGISQTALAQTLDIARSGVVMLIDTLEELNLVSREPLAADKRAYALHLTRAGRATLLRVRRQVAVHEARVCAQLGAKDKKTLLEMLRRVGA
jgi:DNA-binding MarR family transcriptional regulator